MDRLLMRVVNILDAAIDFDRQKAIEHLEFLVSQHAYDEKFQGTKLATIEEFVCNAEDRHIFELDFREYPNLEIEIEYDGTPIRSQYLLNLDELLTVMEYDEIPDRIRDDPLVRIEKDEWVPKSSLSPTNLAKWENGDWA